MTFAVSGNGLHLGRVDLGRGEEDADNQLVKYFNTPDFEGY